LIYDAIVVGAGPAGAVLAYELAQRGLEVLIMEKANLPRYKPCGGGLTRKAVQSLPFDVRPVIDREAAGGIVSYGGRWLLRIDVCPSIASLVMRDRFDCFLVQRAVEAGARLAEGVAVAGVEELSDRVVARTGKDVFAARLLAGADGVESVVARSVGLLARREAGVAVEAELAVPSSALEAQGSYATFDFGALPRGYGWVFPKNEHLSVGLFQATPGKTSGLKRRLETFIASQEVLREHARLSLRGHRIPLGGREESLHEGRVLLVGDAANLADPWLAEGLYYAIVSARMAAAVMAEALERGVAHLKEYTARVNAEIVRQFRYARRFAAVVYRLPRQCSLVLGRSPLMQDAVFGVMRGDLTFQQLSRTLVWRLPRIVAQSLGRRSS
jgi:geranylgeranyl reductase family protein